MNILETYHQMSLSGEDYSFPCVYKITNNVNGEFYVGQTSSFHHRVKDHLKEMINQIQIRLELLQETYSLNDFSSMRRKSYYVKEKWKTESNKLKLSYRNGMISDFSIEILEKCESIIQLLDREHKWIIQLNADKSLNGKS